MGLKKEDRYNNGNVHPRRIFKTPEELYQAFEDYKVARELEAQKWPKIQYVGKDGLRKEDYPVMPYTLESFFAFCYSKYGTVEQYFTNQDGYYNDFIGISHVIKNECKAQLTTGGLLGHYSQSLTARIHGYTDRQDLTSGGEKLKNEPMKVEIIRPEKEDDD